MRPCSHVKALVDDDGAVLLDLKRDRYFAMNEVAADIWRGVEAGQTVPDIERALCEQYEVDAATVRAQVTDFLAMLTREALIEHDL